jgi:hypothetical protein
MSDTRRPRCQVDDRAETCRHHATHMTVFATRVYAYRCAAHAAREAAFDAHAQVYRIGKAPGRALTEWLWSLEPAPEGVA